MRREKAGRVKPNCKEERREEREVCSKREEITKLKEVCVQCAKCVQKEKKKKEEVGVECVRVQNSKVKRDAESVVRAR